MDYFAFTEIILAVVMVLGGQKGLEVYHRKKHANGNGRERRKNSFADSDKEFIRGCFKDQTKEIGSEMRNDRLELMIGLKEMVQSEGEKTRVAVRAER
ncbi:hypothetical protein LCGC14_2402700 [marine sediment metagenome]|uniref:Uncharacterized protein n=1 Tax=marine sediment metagenome TaxID=412755 RepID=A0A0F9E786_9ZZZZ